MKNIENGLAFIANHQRDNGSFETYISKSADRFIGNDKINSTFITSLICKSLAIHNSRLAVSVGNLGSSWLLSQRRDNWQFNYDETDTKTSHNRYPNDLDDTFCALSAIQRFSPHSITGKTLAAVTNTLFNNEINEGGPYKTWIVPSELTKKWKNIDPAVNANILCFLNTLSIRLPNTEKYLETCIRTKSLSSKYYVEVYQIYYFMSEWYRGEMMNDIAFNINQTKQSNFWGSPHNAALNLITLLRFGVSPTNLTSVKEYIIENQRPNGGWNAHAVWVDSHRNDTSLFAGSDEYTSALCVEALVLYESALKRSISSSTVPSASQVYTTNVTNSVIHSISSLQTQSELRLTVDAVFQRIMIKDPGHKIIQLPLLVNKSISADTDTVFLERVSKVSVWGWMAYTAYDDVMDRDGNKSLVPGANFSLRMMQSVLESILPRNQTFHTEALNILNTQDAANAWELANCRVYIKNKRIQLQRLPYYQDYEHLAQKSLGHTIAGIGVLYAAGYKSGSPTMRALRAFFKHYLVARQLNDDAHDWEEDLQNGHINSVAVLILQQYLDLHNQSRRIINLAKEEKLLRNIMWNSVIIEVNDKINRHIIMASKALSIEGSHIDPRIMAVMLEPIKESVKESLLKRAKTLEFIENL